MVLGSTITLRRSVMLLAVMALAACSPQLRNPFDGPSPAAGPISVDVENGLTMDVGVYAVRGGTRFRVGSVPSLSRRTLKMPRSLLGGGGSVQLMADPLGSRESYATQSLIVPDGSRISWAIVPGLRLSQATVRR